MSDPHLRVACVVAYLALCVGTGLSWEPSHDEGVAWRQAIGHLRLPGVLRPAPVQQLYATLDGEASRSAGDVLDALMVRGGMHPPAYYLMIHWWTAIAGTSRLALNAPAYLCGVLALFGIHGLARRLVPHPRSGLWAMALLAASPWFVGFSTLAKPYGIAVALAIASSNAVLRIHASPHSLRWRAAFVAFSVLGLYTIYHYAFVVAWQGALLLLLAARQPAARRAREIAWVCGLGAAIAAGFAPWLPRLALHLDVSAAQPHYFSGAIPLGEWPTLMLGVLRIFVLGEGLRAVGSEWMRGVAGGLALLTLPLALRCFSRSARADLDADALSFWASLVLIPAWIVIGDLWRDTHTFFVSKLCFPLMPLGVVLVVRAWSVLPRPALRSLGLAAWLGLLLTASVLSIYTRSVALTPFEAVARHLEQTDSPAHLLVLNTQAQGYVIPLLLGLRSAGVRELKIGQAPTERLWPLLEAARRNPEIERVSLVNLAVTYRPQHRWSLPALHTLRQQAEDAGWRVALLDPGSALNARNAVPPRWTRGSAEREGKTLVISALTNVKYYSMEISGNAAAIQSRP